MTDGTTVQELAEHVGGSVARGDAARRISRVMPIEHADASSVAFISDAKYSSFLESTQAGVVMIEPSMVKDAPEHLTLIAVEAPYVAFARASQRLAPVIPAPQGVHPAAELDETAVIERGAQIGPFVVVGPRAHIGQNAVLHAGVHVEADAKIGEGSVLENHVVVKYGCEVGARNILHAGVVIGADGFGFAQRVEAGKLAEHVKIMQVGTVVLEDDVEIGSNSTVDRGTLGVTRVGRGSKIDNLVQVGHNVDIGERCILVAQSGVAGSSKLGEEVIMGAQSGVSGHIEVGARASLYGQAGLKDNLPEGAKVAGTPAINASDFFRTVVRLSKLDTLFSRVKKLEKAVFGGDS